MSDMTLGFRTRAGQIQKELDKLTADLDVVSVKWSVLADNAAQGVGEARKELREISKSSKTPEPLFMMQLSLYQFWSLMQVVGLLGIQATVMHKQLTKLEKTTKELKLAKK